MPEISPYLNRPLRTLTQAQRDLECGAPTMCDAPELFDAARWPKLRKVGHSDYYGTMTLLSVEETSDGFLMGYASFADGRDEHSVFIGRASDFV